jgi:hypothetical protein
MRSLVAVLLVAGLGCSSNSFDVQQAEDDTGAPSSDTSVASDSGGGGPDTTTPPPIDGAAPDTSVPPPPDSTVSVDAKPIDAGPAVCARNSECPLGHYCSYAGCAVMGVCKPLVPSPGPYFDPVCGCNGVTFWNAQHAWVTSSAIAHEGPCEAGERKTCTGPGTACGGFADSMCVVQVGEYSECGASPLYGGCWRMPTGNACAGSPAGVGPPMLPCSGSTCRSQCEAIKAKASFYPASCTTT